MERKEQKRLAFNNFSCKVLESAAVHERNLDSAVAKGLRVLDWRLVVLQFL